ncbi:EamA family transporter [Patescibacteria group bacterium]
MVTGIIFAVISGFLYAVTNVIDKVVVGKHITRPLLVVVFGSLIVFVFGILMLPFVESVYFGHLLLFLLNAVITFIAATLYFAAIKIEEPSRIVPLFSFITIFITLMSAIFLGEVFRLITYLGIGIIVIGTWIISSRNNIFSPFRSRAIGYIISASFLWAFIWVVNKYLLDFYSVISLMSYQFIFEGIIGTGLTIYFFNQISAFWKEKKKFVGLQWLNEFIAAIASLAYLIAAGAWFVSLTSAVSSIQYLFIFIFAIILHRLRPELMEEQINKRVVWQKIIAIIFIISGIFIISL